MRNYKKITVIFILFLAVIFLLPEKVFAQEVWGVGQLNGLNLGTRSLSQIITGIINIALGFLGVIALVIILYGGYTWMTSGGNAEKIDKAKKTLLNGFIGLVIITSAYAIAQFIFKDAMNIINNTSSGSGGGSGYNAPTNGLGADTLEGHYPLRNARDVARNTNAFVTFTENMKIDTIVNTGVCTVISATEHICDAHNNLTFFNRTNTTQVLNGPDLRVTYDPTNPTWFDINPFGTTAVHLGSDTEIQKYTVELSGFLTANETTAFRSPNIYRWDFTVSTALDTVAPYVVSVFPIDGSTFVPLNSVVRVTFSEAVNPIFAAGIAPPFAGITLTGTGAGSPGLLEGEYRMANQYKTVEFLTTNDCGENSCGDRIYCLPEPSGGATEYDIAGVVKSLIRDMAGIEMVADYTWDFRVDDSIDVTPPYIVAMEAISGVALDANINIRFNEGLQQTSVNGRTAILEREDPISGLPQTMNYWSTVIGGDTIAISHDPFTPSTKYLPRLNSGIRNNTQNCWFPCECDADAGETCYCTNDTVGTNCPGGQGDNCSRDSL